MIADQIGNTGFIKSGQLHAGFSIRIEKDTHGTNGYFIIVWNDDTRECWDDWVQSLDELENYFERVDWVIEWAKPISDQPAAEM